MEKTNQELEEFKENFCNFCENRDSLFCEIKVNIFGKLQCINLADERRKMKKK